MAALVVAASLASSGASAKTIHKEGEDLDLNGIVTTFHGLVRHGKNMNEKPFSVAITNWFGKNGAVVDDDTFVSWIYMNQITFCNGEGGEPGKNAAGCIWEGSAGDGWYKYRPTGETNDWGEAKYERSHVLDGFESPSNPGALIRPCDRPSDLASDMTAVWREIPKWEKNGDVSFACIGNEGFYVLPDREKGWDEEEGGTQWKPHVWTTDVPRFKLNVKAQFPTYWDDGSIAFHTKTMPYEVTLAVWSVYFDGSIPPGKEYYKKLTFSGTAVKAGKGGFEEYFATTHSLGERLPEGRYTAYMEIRSPLSKSPPAYCRTDFEVKSHEPAVHQEN
jgi:hypothetical protein